MPDDHNPPGNEVPESLGDLARDLTRLARTSPKALAQRVAGLSVRQQAELALRLPPAQRLDLLLHAPRPMRLVRSLPDADLYLTVREVGPADAMPVIALASAQQIQHLIDLESWRRDRFDADRSGAWAALILEAGEPALKRFLRHADDELLILLLQRWARIEQIEYEDTPDAHGHGESEAGNEQGRMTPDGSYRFSPTIPEHGPAIGRLLQIFYIDHPRLYRELFWRALNELPAEMEEAAFRWRQSRMEEHGFPGWDDALTIYAAPEGLKDHAAPLPPTDPDGLPSPRSLLPAIATSGPLLQALDSLPGDRRELALHGLVSVANHILVADHFDCGDPEAHRAAMRKAAGFVSIGISRRGAVDASGVARVVDEVPMTELFREGHARAAELQHRARELVRRGWASGSATALELLDPPIRERVDALRGERPLYFEVTGPGTGTVRDFARPEELDEAFASLRMAEVIGDLLVRRLGLDPGRAALATERDPARPVRFSTVLLTLMAWHATRGEIRGDALPPDVAAGFLREVASRRTAGPEAPNRAISRLVEALSGKLELSGPESSVLLAFGRYCLEQLAEECGSLDPGIPLDPGGVTCLLLAR